MIEDAMNDARFGDCARRIGVDPAFRPFKDGLLALYLKEADEITYINMDASPNAASKAMGRMQALKRLIDVIDSKPLDIEDAATSQAADSI